MKQTTLGKACVLKSGKFVSAAEIQEQFAEGLYPCYGGNGVRGYVSEYSHEGDYPLIGRQGALCGNVNYATGKFRATEHAVVVQPVEEINTRWLFYKLIAMDLGQYATGAAQPGLAVSKLEQLPICIPSVSEQENAAKVFDSIENLIALRKEQLAKLDELVKARFVEVLTPYFASSSIAPLIELVDSGRPITYGILKPGTNIDGGLPVIRVKDYSRGLVSPNEVLHTSQEIYNKYLRSVLKENDVIISIGGTIGRIEVIPKEFEGANITQHTARIALKDKSNVLFYKGLLETPMMQNWMKERVLGVAQPSLNLGDVKMIPVPIVSTVLQKELAEFYRRATKSKLTIQASLDKLEVMKKALMKEYFG